VCCSLLAWPGLPAALLPGWLAVLGAPLPPSHPLDKAHHHSSTSHPASHPSNQQALAAYQLALDLLPSDQDTIDRMHELEAAARRAGHLPPLSDEMGFNDAWPQRMHPPMISFHYLLGDPDDEGYEDQAPSYIPMTTDGSHLQHFDYDVSTYLPGRSSIWLQGPRGKRFQLKSEREGGGFTKRELAAQIVKIYQQEAKMNPDSGDDDCRRLHRWGLCGLTYYDETDEFTIIMSS